MPSPYCEGADIVSDVMVDPARWESIEGAGAAFVEGWLACEGDRVRSGQRLGSARLADWRVDIEAPHDGVLEEICVPVGEPFARGQVLARLVNF
ncbi:biotin/lipoyl-containing protein [Hydrogenophaga sp. BPS33]|uniref:biotin/lipoyl-containing protein n=1 Tax=Hydrogenophaga sp. BPS33 TaxID=2651974 RepID=UPI0013201A36|nr:hypothetical protein F9K07_15610 [Hydrogenophaga sp. BPS33]